VALNRPKIAGSVVPVSELGWPIPQKSVNALHAPRAGLSRKLRRMANIMALVVSRVDSGKGLRPVSGIGEFAGSYHPARSPNQQAGTNQ